MSREQRQALDRQLNTQAFYAAETGVADAAKAIRSGQFSAGKPDCAPVTATLLDDAHYKIDAAGGVEYTCVLIKNDLPSAEFSSLDPSKPAIMNPHTTTPVSKIALSWQDEGGSTAFATTFPNFPNLTSWGSWPGVVQLSITPLNGAINHDSLRDNTFHVFLYPTTGGSGSVSYTTNAANQGSIVGGQCNTTISPTHPRHCKVVISGLPAGTTDLLIRAQPLYKAIAATLETFDSSNNVVTMQNVQSQVDVTGKANDVFRRIQVRIPSRNQYDYSAFALQSGLSICKRTLVQPTNATVDTSVAGEPPCDPFSL
jgi:hypothetical protein